MCDTVGMTQEQPHNGEWYRPDGNPVTTGDERTSAILAHVSALAAMLLSVGWLNFVGPLVLWLINKDHSRFARTAAAQSFNFNLGMTVLSIIGWLCFFTIIGIPVAVICWVMSFLLTVYHSIRAAISASKGVQYNYPFQLRILS